MAPLRYVSLISETRCQNCCSEGVFQVCWVARLRLCEECFNKLFVQSPICPNGIDEAAWKKAQRHHSATLPWSSRRFSYSKAMCAVAKELRGLSPSDQNCYVDRLAGMYSEQMVRKTFLKRRGERLAMFLELQRRDFSRIVAYMETLGYKELIANDEIRDSLSTYPLVLSDRVEWSHPKAAIIEYLEDYAQRTALYKRFRSLGGLLLSMETKFPVVRCHETYIDIALLPEVKKVLHIHYKREISKPEWKKLRRVIPAAFSRWRRTVDS
ncbi:hypothetical protein HETIRDRAFT_427952 [Heterobasidion irregulare TC 32-1]|uniref:Uncharacterized protein n=1 Tax=Heterobasidion irregulare (strain TC 32-1) TaxID=747525 RepID=W4K773_HETIT|nr:uncharacterized protein HETIRDRAFT_427952 [Heterobasidion irregulare TC 32-1]ETW81190.1 hypothetical protein HETIRDRAFT_427952 [Heterobasidion irregulare TC 32-1]